MRPEEVTTIKEALGATLGELAEALGVTLRQVQNWTDGTTTPPPDRQERLLSLLARKREIARAFINQARWRAMDTGSKGPVYLIRYPDSKHLHGERHWVWNAGIAEAFIELMADGFPVRVVQFSPVSFDVFRGKREDTAETRKAWAATCPPPQTKRPKRAS